MEHTDKNVLMCSTYKNIMINVQVSANFICISHALCATSSTTMVTFRSYNFLSCNTHSASCCNSELEGTTDFLLSK